MPSEAQSTTSAPAMPLWRLHRAGHDAVCEILIGPCGYEGRFLYDGRFLYSYHFTRPDDAVAWASEREAQCRLAGWTSES
jgi:hypothetical protein